MLVHNVMEPSWGKNNQLGTPGVFLVSMTHESCSFKLAQLFTEVFSHKSFNITFNGSFTWKELRNTVSHVNALCEGLYSGFMVVYSLWNYNTDIIYSGLNWLWQDTHYLWSPWLAYQWYWAFAHCWSSENPKELCLNSRLAFMSIPTWLSCRPSNGSLQLGIYDLGC